MLNFINGSHLVLLEFVRKDEDYFLYLAFNEVKSRYHLLLLRILGQLALDLHYPPMHSLALLLIGTMVDVAEFLQLHGGLYLFKSELYLIYSINIHPQLLGLVYLPLNNCLQIAQLVHLPNNRKVILLKHAIFRLDRHQSLMDLSDLV
jgi:hypothetical protein